MDCVYNPGWISGAKPAPPAPNTTCNVPECTPNFDDSTWSTINLPHDFVIYGTFNPNAGK